jgi:hypothetical protein
VGGILDTVIANHSFCSVVDGSKVVFQNCQFDSFSFGGLFATIDSGVSAEAFPDFLPVCATRSDSPHFITNADPFPSLFVRNSDFMTTSSVHRSPPADGARLLRRRRTAPDVRDIQTLSMTESRAVPTALDTISDIRWSDRDGEVD